MTRKEKTASREHDLYFSNWIREKLPDSNTGYRCYDVDFVLWNKHLKKIMFVELKSYNSKPRPDQYLMFTFLNRWILKGIDKDWSYCGYHLIQFENTSFEDGKCFLDGNEILEDDLINFLSL